MDGFGSFRFYLWTITALVFIVLKNFNVCAQSGATVSFKAAPFVASQPVVIAAPAPAPVAAPAADPISYIGYGSGITLSGISGFGGGGFGGLGGFGGGGGGSSYGGGNNVCFGGSCFSTGSYNYGQNGYSAVPLTCNSGACYPDGVKFNNPSGSNYSYYPANQNHAVCTQNGLCFFSNNNNQNYNSGTSSSSSTSSTSTGTTSTNTGGTCLFTGVICYNSGKKKK